MDREKLIASTRLACNWLTKVAQVKSRQVIEKPIAKGCPCYGYKNWRGALRNEYVAAERQWYFFGTVWHTGQAAKALVKASQALKDASLLGSANLAARFITNQQVLDKSDPSYGFIRAYEDVCDWTKSPMINTSGILESLDGLIHLAEVGETNLWDNVLAALHRVADTFYIDGEGLFRGPYYPAEDKIYTNDWFVTKDKAPGRPLLDDGVFLKGYRRCGEERFKRIFLETADRLIRDEDPPGNWMHYSPSNPKLGTIHPRMSYWWGRPMLMAYAETKDPKYLDCAKRCADFLTKALRRDGGIFRTTDKDFNTSSFGQATSGSACAAILWMDYQQATGERIYDEHISRALEFCMSVQLAKAKDRNLRGCILEKVVPPDGTDASPYHNRDLGSSFFVQAASQYLMRGRGKR